MCCSIMPLTPADPGRIAEAARVLSGPALRETISDGWRIHQQPMSRGGITYNERAYEYLSLNAHSYTSLT